MASKIKNKKSTESPYNILTSLYIYLILVFMALVVDDYYVNITETKFYFYLIVSGMYIFSILLTKLYFIFIEKNNNLKLKDEIKLFFTTMNLGDIGMLAFTIISLISTLLSRTKMYAFTGSYGRYNGFITTMIFCFTYFLITRNIKFNKKMLIAFLVSGILVALFGVIQFFKIDLFGFKANLDDKYKGIAFSTLGNINVYTAYLVLVISISFILFCKAKSIANSIFYFFVVNLGYFAIIFGVSDNAYLALGTLFVFSPIYLFDSLKSIKKYIILITSFLFIIKIINYLTEKIPEKIYLINSIFTLISKYKHIWYLIIFFIMLIILMQIIDYKKNIIFKKNRIQIICFSVSIVFIGSIVFFIYYVNSNKAAELPTFIKRYFIFSDSWGSYRGFIWRKSIETFSTLSIKDKLFGYGPDTFLVFSKSNFAEDMSKYSVVFDSPHNEWIQNLITTGILGVISYFLFVAGSLYYILKNGRKNEYAMSIFFAVLAFYAQSMVNINNILVPPIMMTLFMVGVGYSRELKKKNIISQSK